MKHLKKFENFSEKNIIEDIKKSLIMETLVDEDEFNELFNGDWDLAWKKFVDEQVNGECQGIVSSIIIDFPQVKKVFGEIEIDESYIDSYGDEQTLMTHHWVTIDDVIYDFSKGTLVDYIEWSDKYDVSVDGEEWRYNLLNKNR
jgi:hypothetical protein